MKQMLRFTTAADVQEKDIVREEGRKETANAHRTTLMTEIEVLTSQVLKSSSLSQQSSIIAELEIKEAQPPHQQGQKVAKRLAPLNLKSMSQSKFALYCLLSSKLFNYLF